MTPAELAAIREEFVALNGPEPQYAAPASYEDSVEVHFELRELRRQWKNKLSGFLLAHTSSKMAKERAALEYDLSSRLRINKEAFATQADNEELIKYAKKVAQCIYIAVNESIAEDVKNILYRLIARVEELYGIHKRVAKIPSLTASEYQKLACKCPPGTCESKVGASCRMAEEISAAKGAQ